MSTSKILTAEEILAADDLVLERVETPEWGGAVFIRTMSSRERDAFEAQTVKQQPRRVNGKNVTETVPNLANVRARMVALTCCDASGRRLFTAEQVRELGEKSSRVLDRLFDVAKRLNGFSEDDIEDLAGNSGAGPSASSGSASRAT